MYPENLKYTKDHEWAKIDGELATVGITSRATESLGDIVFVELPKVGKEFSQFAEFGVVESVKSVSSLYLPLGGEVVEVNDAVLKKPETINSDPYGAGWLIKVKVKNPAEASNLLSAADYQKLL
jgi:glycine cleavage system H protein